MKLEYRSGSLDSLSNADNNWFTETLTLSDVVISIEVQQTQSSGISVSKTLLILSKRFDIRLVWDIPLEYFDPQSSECSKWNPLSSWIYDVLIVV